LLQRENTWKQFLFVDIRITDQLYSAKQYPQIIRIPKGKYLCKVVTESEITQAWKWSSSVIAKEQIELIIETELFVGNYNFLGPVLEQRCLLKS